MTVNCPACAQPWEEFEYETKCPSCGRLWAPTPSIFIAFALISLVLAIQALVALNGGGEHGIGYSISAFFLGAAAWSSWFGRTTAQRKQYFLEQVEYGILLGLVAVLVGGIALMNAARSAHDYPAWALAAIVLGPWTMWSSGKFK
jgi:hypothetical protein